jgi:hypothetical protein
MSTGTSSDKHWISNKYIYVYIEALVLVTTLLLMTHDCCFTFFRLMPHQFLVDVPINISPLKLGVHASFFPTNRDSAH